MLTAIASDSWRGWSNLPSYTPNDFDVHDIERQAQAFARVDGLSASVALTRGAALLCL